MSFTARDQREDIPPAGDKVTLSSLHQSSVCSFGSYLSFLERRYLVFIDTICVNLPAENVT